MVEGSGRKQDQEREQRDASPTEFPKSARPIYVKFGTLIIIVACLCVIADQCDKAPDGSLKSNDNVIVEEAGMKLPFDLEGEEVVSE